MFVKKEVFFENKDGIKNIFHNIWSAFWMPKIT